MIIKKFNKFKNENKQSNSEIEDLGLFIEKNIKHDYIKNIINRYISDIDPSIRVANAVNLLDDKTKKDIKRQVIDYLNNGIIEKDPKVQTYIMLNKK